MNKLISVVFVVVIVMTCCKQKTIPADDLKKVDIDLSNDPIETMVLQYEFSISNPVVDDFIKTRIARNPMNVQLLLNNYKGTSSDKKYLITFFRTYPDFLERYGKFPYVKNIIYLTDDKIVTNKEGLTYYYDTKLYKTNNDLTSYLGYKKSLLISSAGINFMSTKRQTLELDRTVMSVIDESKYSRIETGVTSTIAGYEAEEVIFQLKEKESTPLSLNVPEELTVYISPTISKEVNSSLPIQLSNEPYGILKAVIRYRAKAKDPFYFIMEVKSIETKMLKSHDYGIGVSKLFWTNENSDDDFLYVKGVGAGIDVGRYFIAPTMQAKKGN